MPLMGVKDSPSIDYNLTFVTSKFLQICQQDFKELHEIKLMSHDKHLNGHYTLCEFISQAIKDKLNE